MTAGIFLTIFFFLVAHVFHSAGSRTEAEPGFECAVCNRQLPERRRAQGKRCRRCWVNMTNR